MPPTLAAALTIALSSLPAPYRDADSPDARKALLASVAGAIAQAAPCPEEAAVLAAVGYSESRFARAVVERRTPMPDVGGFAMSAWSLHTGNSLVPYPVWVGLGGIDHLPQAAAAAERVLAYHRQRCGHDRWDWREAEIAGFATGGKCRWSGAGQRAWLAKKLQARIEAELSR